MTISLLKVGVLLPPIVLGALIGWLMEPPFTEAEIWHVHMHNEQVYPGYGNEIVCVKDDTSANVDIQTARTLIDGWLNDPNGWERIGTTSVNFEFHYGDCSAVNENIQIRLGDGVGNGVADQDPDPYFGPIHHNHDHPTWREVTISGIFWETWIYDEPIVRDAVVHEVGHAFGTNHGGPSWGIVNGGFLYDGATGVNPGNYEILQIQDHLAGRPVRPLSVCAGFSIPTELLVDWWDTEAQENLHEVQVFRQDPGSSQWINMGTFTQSATGLPLGPPQLPWGLEAAQFSIQGLNIASYPGANWRAQVRTRGGPLNNYTTAVTSLPEPASSTIPGHPCLVKATQIDGDTNFTFWKDAAYNEDGFRVERAFVVASDDVTQGQFYTPWTLRANITTPNANAFTDDNIVFPTPPPGDPNTIFYACYRIKAYNTVGSTTYYSTWWTDVVCATD